MAIADFRTAPSGAFPPGTDVGGITFTSGSPMEVRPGAGPAAGENGLGQAGGAALAITARWTEPATTVIVRISLHDNATIRLYDHTGRLVEERNIDPVPVLVWQNVLFLPAYGAVRAVITDGGVNPLVSLLYTG